MTRRTSVARTGRALSQRQLRVGEELRHALADILLREEFRDPDLADVRLTVSEVRVSADLKRATAFVAPLGGGDAAAPVAALNRAARFVRGRVGRQVRLKFTPAIAFVADTGFERAARIDRLLAGARD